VSSRDVGRSDADARTDPTTPESAEKVSSPGRRHDYAPVGSDERATTMATVKRTLSEFSEDNMSDWAAAPALIALVSIVGLFGDPQTTTQKVTEIVTRLGPKSAADTFAGPIKSITTHRSAAGILFVVSLLLALNAASGYVGAFMRAANIVYETPEGRPFWKLKPLQIGVTLVMVLLLAALALGLVLTGPVVTAVAGPLGIGHPATTLWDIAKWPVMVAVFVLMLGVLFHASPNVRLPGFKWVTPGAILALVVWVVASALFAFYVANFGAYDKTYGTLGGVVVLLLWLWLTNVSLLLGMEFNAERERSRELAAGIPRADREIQLDARAEPKDKKTT
jgi:membrane protein